MFVTVAVTWGIFCGVERVNLFVNVHLRCIDRNLKMISKMSTTLPPGKASADAHVGKAPRLPFARFTDKRDKNIRLQIIRAFFASDNG